MSDLSLDNNRPVDMDANGSSTVTDHAVNAKDSLFQSASSAMAAVSNHSTTQNLKSNIANGPVAEKAKAEGAKTKAEFSDLANARTTPDQPAATGQPLTHYHSMFYRLLSWKNPRATAISFAAAVIFIFAARYLNVIRYIFKALYMTLGITATAELAGSMTIGKGLTSQFRPRQYFTIPKASLERLLDDVEQFINFFVIESQRIVFAENVYATVAAFFASLISYFLIKFVPLWGLSLIATVIAYLGPLVYIKNKEVIDAQLEKGYHIANQQATQLKNLASQHTGNAAKTVQGYTQQYTAKAQETINSYRGRSASPEAKKQDLPSAPTHEPAPVIKEEPVAEPAL
uniref:Reticulon-like protein n=2 Tax=Helminthosporium solani TaxID=58128 RepID=A0A514YLI9_9PLEO|nr:putative reticulon-like protein [Helminthosporium solani]